MKIIVVDNINWQISYSEIEAFIAYQGFPISWVIGECEQYLKKDVCYLINVHCVFNTGKVKDENTLLQDQSGVVFYRHLLKIYSEQERKLKVAFFSPIPREKLLNESQKPENEVLNIYPFIEIPTEWNEFVSKIYSLKESDWTSLNNASENLLSGWALSNKNGINSFGKKILFIDDQNEQWKTTLENIFSKSSQSKSIIEILPYDKGAEPKGEFSLSKLDASFKVKVRQYDLIISDFYLEENHEINHWMNKIELEQKSGFKLFNEIKKENKGVPVVMHTSSNKISYYKIFDSYGIDNWFIKDARPDSSKEEKKESYLTLKKSLEEILSKDYYKELVFYWNKVLELERKNDLWWIESSNADEQQERKTNADKFEIILADATTKKIIVKILKSSWFAIRRLLNREVVFEENSEEENTLIFDHFTANSICSNLGKIFELLNIKSNTKRLSILVTFLTQIRNSSSHSYEYELLTIDDALICFDYFLFGLLSGKSISELQTKFPGQGDFLKTSFDDNLKSVFPYQLFWLYFQFNDRHCSENSFLQKSKLKKRTKELYSIVQMNNVFQNIIHGLKIRADNKKIEINTLQLKGELIDKREENLFMSYTKFHKRFNEIAIRLNASK